MNKKVEAIVESYETYIGKNVKTYDTPGTSGLYLDEHDGDPVNIDDYVSFVGKVMFLPQNCQPKQVLRRERSLETYQVLVHNIRKQWTD